MGPEVAIIFLVILIVGAVPLTAFVLSIIALVKSKQVTIGETIIQLSLRLAEYLSLNYPKDFPSKIRELVKKMNVNIATLDPKYSKMWRYKKEIH